MFSRHPTTKLPFGWVSAFAFNTLLVAAAAIVCMIVFEMRNALGEEFATSNEATTATRERMGKMFEGIVPDDVNRREYWANRVRSELRENDIVSARGFLLAAPYMLDSKDTAAVRAAATTDPTGDPDERLLNAAKLFLPDDVRARYERAVSPYQMEVRMSDTVNVPAANETSPEAELALPETETKDENTSDEETVPPEPTLNEPETNLIGTTDRISFDSHNDFFVLGSERDLAYQSAGWIRGDTTDVFSLSLSGLGLVAGEEMIGSDRFDDRFFQGASLVKSARRANRLNEKFSEFLERRLEMALPEEKLKSSLESAFRNNANLLIQGDAILKAFADSVEQDHLAPFRSDLFRIGAFSVGRSNSAAMTILQTVTSGRDLKRAELITSAGGDRAVTLTKYLGNDALSAATSVMDWTMRLIQLIISLIVVMVMLFWITVFTFARSFGQKNKRTRTYGYS